jgi:RNA polymerase sigma factor (sigma-70 family)
MLPPVTRTLSHTATTTQLLAALHEGSNESVWLEFDRRFRPIVYGLARRLDLDEDRAADVAQQTMTEFLRDYRAGRYDRAKGRLRSWILGIARHRALDALRDRARHRGWRGESAIAAVPGPNAVERIWDEESDRIMFQQAMQSLREATRTEPRTLHVFERVALDAVPPRVVAEEFDLAVDEVYRIKNRVTKRLRAIVAELRAAWEVAA